jgi:hypothetical protein
MPLKVKSPERMTRTGVVCGTTPTYHVERQGGELLGMYVRQECRTRIQDIYIYIRAE